MKSRMVDSLILAWLKRLRFHEWWIVSFGVEISGTWHDTGQRVVEWKLDLDELNREVCICVTIGLGLDDEYTINLDFDFEYIIVYSFLQIIRILTPPGVSGLDKLNARADRILGRRK